MKKQTNPNQGSVLLVTFMTITILTLICATSLYVASQNTNTTAQTASWQQSLTGTETLISQAVDALNATADSTNPNYNNRWVGWKVVTQSGLASGTPVTLPTLIDSTSGPSPAPSSSPATISTSASGPAANQYYYYVPTGTTMQGEIGNKVAGWVTIDSAGGTPLQQTINSNTYQWYRIRATGTAQPPSGQGWLKRIGGNKLDNDLRKISLITDRKTGQAGQKAYRAVEVIAQPVLNFPGGPGAGFTMKGSVKFSGMEMMDSFNSRSGTYASQATHTYSHSGGPNVTYANSNIQIGTQNSTGSNFNNQLVFGNVIYSGPTLKGTDPDSHGYGGTQGTVSTPFAGTIPPVSDPTLSGGATWTNLGGPNGNISTSGGVTLPDGTVVKYYKYNGDYTANSGQTLNVSPNGGATNQRIVVWVTGNINLNAKNNIVVANGVTLWLYGDKDINFWGGSFNNQNAYSSSRAIASTMVVYGVDTAGKMTVSSNPSGDPDRGTFIGQINAPGYYVNVKSDFDYYGSVIGSTTQTSSAARYHYDEALNPSAGGTVTVSNYAYASWFEDTR